jgi:uncharacterized Fe-S cluster-containing radical SAM superfamily protein
MVKSLYDPAERAAAIATGVCGGTLREYCRFGPTRFYGGIFILSSDSSEIGAFIRESSKEKLLRESPADVLRRLR